MMTTPNTNGRISKIDNIKSSNGSDRLLRTSGGGDVMKSQGNLF